MPSAARPGRLVGHIPLIETVGDIGVDDIDQTNGLATGSGVIGAFSVLDSPFGGVVTITGRIGNPPNSFGGGATSFKYRIEVFGPPPFNSWQPLTTRSPSRSPNVLGFPQPCAPGDFVCDVPLTPTDDGDGFGPGWYTYLEDITGANQRFLVVDKLASWFTNAAMEGTVVIRITAKDPTVPLLFPGVQVVKVRIDNTAPSGPAGPSATPAQIEANPPLAMTGATFNGNPIPAIDCGKFPVGHDHHRDLRGARSGRDVARAALPHLTLDVIPDGLRTARARPVGPVVPDPGADHRRGGELDAEHRGDGSVRLCAPTGRR